MLFSVFMLVSIAAKLYRLEVVPAVLTSTIGKLALYPVIITLSWVLNTVAMIYTFSNDKTLATLSPTWSRIVELGIVFATAQGFFNALVFFAMNPLVRAHWWSLFGDIYATVCCCGCCCADKEHHQGNIDDTKILADLEAARSSNMSNISLDTKLNTARNSTVVYTPHSTHINGNNNINSNSNNSYNNGTNNAGSFSHSRHSLRRSSYNAKSINMVRAVENQLDFIGTPSDISAQDNHSLSGNSVNTTGTSNTAHTNTSTNVNYDSRFDSNGEYMNSTESSSSPITTMMAGLKKTADGEGYF